MTGEPETGEVVKGVVEPENEAGGIAPPTNDEVDASLIVRSLISNEEGIAMLVGGELDLLASVDVKGDVWGKAPIDGRTTDRLDEHGSASDGPARSSSGSLVKDPRRRRPWKDNSRLWCEDNESENDMFLSATVSAPDEDDDGSVRVGSWIETHDGLLPPNFALTSPNSSDVSS